jgi:hypothetical protein
MWYIPPEAGNRPYYRTAVPLSSRVTFLFQIFKPLVLIRQRLFAFLLNFRLNS